MKTLLFDFGGVLVDLDQARCVKAFDRIGFDVRPFLGTFVQSGILSALERGQATVPEFCDQMRQATGLNHLTDEQITDAWRQYLVGVPAERLELLLKIGHHYPVCLLSNTNEIHWAMARDGYFRYKGHCVNDFFKKIFLSYEMGMEKPAPEIFEAVVKEIGCPAEDIIFFDDSAENAKAAISCGLQARVAPANGEWMKFFSSDGVYLP